MSVFDRTTEEGINDTFLEAHAEISKDLFNKEIWRIRYAGVAYVNEHNTDFWDVYNRAVSCVQLYLYLTHKKGAANIKVRKHIDMCHVIKLKKIFFDELNNGEYITYKGERYYKNQEHSNLVIPFAREISRIYPIYKYKLSI